MFVLMSNNSIFSRFQQANIILRDAIMYVK